MNKSFGVCVRTEFWAKMWDATAAPQFRQGRHVIALHVSVEVGGKEEGVPQGRHEFSRTRSLAFEIDLRYRRDSALH